MYRRARAVGLFVVIAVVLAACTSTARQSAPIAPPSTAAPVAVTTAAPTAALPTAVPPALTPTVPPAPPPPTAEAAQPPLYVTNTGSDGLTLRRAPGAAGERIAVLPDGTPLTPTGQQQQADGRLWRQVKDAQGREGWVAADFLTADAPAPAVVAAPTATPTTLVAATPFATQPVPPVAAPSAPKPQPPAAAATATRPPAVVAPTTAPSKPSTSACCRRCTTGRACGDTCISASRNCNVGPGCACNASAEPSSPDVDSMTPEQLAAEAILLAELNADPTPCETFALVEGVE